MQANWNPWHGCSKISSGCLHCYMFRTDIKHGNNPNDIHQTSEFDLPLRKKRDGVWKIASGSLVWTCFTSDFLHEAADEWRPLAWDMIRSRQDLFFFFITKRIDRFLQCIPSDWGAGWDNVEVGCTVENQDRAEYRLPFFIDAPIKRKTLICEPLLESIDFAPWFARDAAAHTVCVDAVPAAADSPRACGEVSADENCATASAFSACDGNSAFCGNGSRIFRLVAGGESGLEARVCRYEWLLSLRRQCEHAGVAFHFKQTGAHFEKDGKVYTIPRHLQHKQAYKAGINYQSYTLQKPSGWKPRIDDGQLELF